MNDQEPQFQDDPAFKAAIQRAWSSERAPETLRQRLASIPAETSATGGRWMIGRNSMIGLGVAAVVLLGMGLLFSQRSQGLLVPEAIADSMVVTHDRCAALPGHHGLKDIQGDDFAAIGAALRSKMGQPVLAVSPGPNWKFRGAAMCRVGSTRCAHLMFSRDGDSLSIFSLPVSYRMKGKTDCALVIQDHPIVGFTDQRGVYCLVGSSTSGQLTVQHLMDIRDQLKSQVARIDSSVIFASTSGVGCERPQ